MTFHTLVALREGLTGANQLVERLGELNDGQSPSLATFYRHLKSGIDAGWIDTASEDEPKRGRGRPQQRYRITKTGVAAATAEANRLRWLADLALHPARTE